MNDKKRIQDILDAIVAIESYRMGEALIIGYYQDDSGLYGLLRGNPGLRLSRWVPGQQEEP